VPGNLLPEEYDLWVDRELTDPEKLKLIYQPYPPDLMERFPVLTLANSPRNDSTECIKPL
jgi:putative SOS response-associated peptidase YedK